MIDYSFIDQIASNLNSNPVFTTVITGAKAMALSLLLLKILNTYMTTLEEHDGVPKMGGILQLIGFGFFIVGSDWIINLIEQVFSGFSFSISSQNIFEESFKVAKEYYKKVNEKPEGWDLSADVEFYISVIPNSLMAGLIILFSLVLMLLDFAVTAVYLLQRLFLLQLFKFLFPFAIALSTTKGFEDMLPRWVKIYIGLFVLGIAYMAIYNFCGIVYYVVNPLLTEKFQVKYDPDTDTLPTIENVFGASCATILLIFMLKLGLMSSVTKEVRGFFN
jgi:hypothetical protein